MNQQHEQNPICVNCGRDETEVPVTEWRFAGGTFWICPDCLPQLIHHRTQVMPRWGLTSQPRPDQTGG